MKDELNLIPKKQHEKVLVNVCPDCGGELRQTACGGLSINKQCIECGSRFNDMWVFGSQRIGERSPHQ